MPARRSVVLVVGFGLTLSAVPALADDAPRQPAAIAKVFECRAITDDTARLACFDKSVGDFEAASSKGDIAVVDREVVRQTRRKLFGFSIPDFGLFGGKKDERGRDVEDQDEVKEIVGKMTAVTRGPDGWVITLEDGARWAQSDGVVLGRNPRVGGTVTIKRGTFGNYKMDFGVGPAVKARRIG